MPRLCPFVIACVLAYSSQVHAVIKVLTPLKKVIAETETIFVAEVEKVDAEKPSVVFKFTENLKGKAPAEKFPVNLTGDSFAKKDEHTKIMLERLAAGRKLVLFTQKIDTTYIAFGYLEGTWFQMKGTIDGDAIRWAFLHCEPYFRRTFKGTTEELKTTIADAITGKKAPPEPDEKEPHGFGPPVEKHKKECESGGTSCPCECNLSGVRCAPAFVGLPLFGVIPSFVLIGPLAILAALFPTLFAGLSGGLKRWRAFTVVASINSLYTGILFLVAQKYKLPDAWLISGTGIASTVLAVILLGMALAGIRYRKAAENEPDITLPPRKNDLITILAFLAFVLIALAVIAYFFGSQELLKSPTREFTAIGAGLMVGAIYTGFRMLTAKIGALSPVRLSLPGEIAGLLGMFAFTGVLLVDALPRTAAITINGIDATEMLPKLEDATVPYENDVPSTALSSIALTDARLYLGTSRNTGFSTRGFLLALDRTTGKKLWEFSDADAKAFYSTPTIAGNRLYFGEGLHTDSDCRLICLDAETGKPVWTKTTKSHTEGSPAVVAGKVYFSAGDDGLYCVNAADGSEVWHYQGVEQNLHVDTSVVVANGRVYAGSGYNTFAAFCLDATTGKPLWKKELPLRSFGTPLVLENQVIFGLGTGNLSEDLSTEAEKNQPKETKPAGMVIALDSATGETVWKVELPRSVHTQLAADFRAVYAASRDGWLYALDRKTGKELWKYSYGTPLTAGPVVAERDGFPIAIYGVSSEGQVYCHSPYKGNVIWSRGIEEATHRKAKVMAAPTLISQGSERTLFVPVTLRNKQEQDIAGIAQFVDRLAE